MPLRRRRNQIVHTGPKRERAFRTGNGAFVARCSICFFFAFYVLRRSVARERSSRGILGSVLSVSQLASASERMANAA